MALDPDGGAAVPTKRKKRRRESAPVVGEQASGGRKTPAPVPSVPDEGTQVGRRPYMGSTNPAFQRLGFSGDIFSFNQRAEVASTAFESFFGYAPSPGLLLDLVRAPVTTEEYEDLFKIPQTFARARALAATKDEPEGQFIEEFEGQAEQEAAGEGYDLLAERTKVERMEGPLTGAAKFFDLTAGQVAESLVYAPYGGYLAGKAIAQDALEGPSLIDLAKGDTEGFTPKRTIELGKAMGAGFKETYSNPTENPGFILLDALGLGSAVVGGGARLGRAASLARKGETKKAIGALARRPEPGRAQLRVGDLVVEKNLSDNALFRQLQRIRVKMLQRQLDKNRLEPLDGFQRPLTRPMRELRKFVSPEATVRRLQKRERQVLLTVDDALRRELLAVAGPASSTSVVMKRLPRKVRRSLTRGEQKAVFISFLDVEGDFTAKAAALREFHERQIALAGQGAKGIDVKAHQRNIRDITLAEKAMETPSKRFQKALALADDVSTAQELIKIQKLGLDPVSAEHRISALAALVRGEVSVPELSAGIAPLKKVVPESRYLPTIPRPKAKKPLGTGESRQGQFGVAAPRPMSELSHRFEGKAMYVGDIQVDTTHLLAETYGRTARTASKVDMFNQLWKASVDKPLGENYVALLPKGQWPDSVRERFKNFEEGALVRREIEALTEDELNRFWDDVVLDPRKVKDIPENVRWVDEALIPEHIYYPKGIRYFSMLGAAINEPIKVARLYAAPRYALNALGNLGMNMIETVAAPRFITRSVRMEKARPDVARTVAALMGEGKSVALNPMDFSVQRWSHAAARVWGAVTDRSFRGGNFYYWAERKGYVTDDDLAFLLDPTLGKRVEPAYFRGVRSVGIRDNLGAQAGVPEWDAQLFVSKSRPVAESYAGDRGLVSEFYLSPGARVFQVKEKGPATRDEWFRWAQDTVNQAKKQGFDVVDFPQQHHVGSVVMNERVLLKREEIERLHDKARRDLVEIVDRANAGMVDFRNLSPVERNVIRHWIFVYPWISRSFVWGMRTMFEHPVKTWTASQLGQIGMKRAEEFWNEVAEDGEFKAPEYLKRGGYVPTSVDEETGIPNVNNFNSVNSFATINDFLGMGRSFFNESPYEGPDDYLSPAADLGARLFFGRDAFGQPFEKGRVQAFEEVWNEIPQVRSVKAQFWPEDFSEEEAVSRPIFIPGFNNTWGGMIAGGLFPRGVDMEALEAKYYRDNPEEKSAKTEEERIQAKRLLIRDEIRTLRALEQVHEQINGRRMPAEVRESLRWLEKFTYDYADYAIRVGREPTAAEKRELELDRLHTEGAISLEAYTKLKKSLGSALHPAQGDDFLEASKLTKWTSDFRKEYLNGEAVADWYEDRNIILDIAHESRNRFRFLKDAGLWDGPLPDKPTLTKQALPGGLGSERPKIDRDKLVGSYDLKNPLFQYGRRYVEFDKMAETLPSPERSELETLRAAEKRAWYDEQDKPLSVGGKQFPSFVRIDWARLDEESRQRRYLEIVKQSWGTLSNFEKELVGRKPAPDVSRGWVAFAAVTDAYRGHVTPDDAPDWLKEAIPSPLDTSSLSKAHKISIAKWVDKNFAPGFYKDYLYSIQPKYRRIQVLPIITKSPAKNEWADIMQAANTSYGYIKQAREAYDSGKKPPYTIGSIQSDWDDYAKNTLYPYLQEEGSDTLKKELELLGGVDFLRTLIADG